MRLNQIVIMLAGHAGLLAGQQVCTQGPGASYGITGYQCASCGLRRLDGVSATYFFGTEPVVNDASPTSPFLKGDVITVVDGKPITTAEGAQEFATPRPGRHAIEFRRWDGASLWRTTVTIIVSDRCQIASIPEVKSQRIAALAAKGERVVERPPALPADPTSRVGFAVSCTPSCTKVTDRSGRVFWKHDGYPAVVAIRKGSPAADAGLEIGDLIADVDGVSVTDEAGSRLLQSYSSQPLTPSECIKCEVPTLTMRVIRSGERRELKVYLQERRP